MKRRRLSPVLASGFTVLGLLSVGASGFGGNWMMTVVLRLTGCLLLLPWPLVLFVRFRRPPTSAVMLWTRIALRRQGGHRPLAHRWVEYRRISPHMRAAIIAGEDVYFPLHDGFDWMSIRQAIRHNRAGHARRGGSTISQQLAKNLFLWPSRSYLRKAVEAYLTIFIETILDKQRILEIYLNIVQFDVSVFGVEAAAREYFAKSAAELAREEAALLAAVLPNPILYRVMRPSHVVRSRQTMILTIMKKLTAGYLAPIETGRVSHS
jgi:monofunctional biosynthetic peptidoglycan transglycosylase